jgi:hypothetical protein
MPKAKDNLKSLDERYPDVVKENNFTLAVAVEPEDVEQKEQMMEAMGETPDERDRRHLQTMSAEVLIRQAIDKQVQAFPLSQ